jgi:nicotinate-nucleotide pyrophosphorylase (carboxylating)
MIKTFDEQLQSFLQTAVSEDVGDGDHSSVACIPPEAVGKARLIIKNEGIIAGVEIARIIFNHLDPRLDMEVLIGDGTVIYPGDVAFYIKGNVHSILKGERLVLNVMQRMSGIATQTKLYVKQILGLPAKVLDTRKTTPGIRFLEKEAVRIGGGFNHRMGLFDMIMIKDNHIDYAGSIESAIIKANDYLQKTGKSLEIIIEARNLTDVNVIIRTGGVRRILLDNFSVEDTRQAVRLINRQYETESSGGINLENIRDYAECGVDFISVGSLTHQINSLDMSLKAVK